ncbi:MAG: ABC transporter ATP-binding protein [Clostridiales bacterium]|nr:ABC transporter ATP-binding protein [Clostridiales bacterium]
MKLELQNVTKQYGKKKALDNLSLVLEPGIYGLLGPNGAGKSTLMNLLTDNIKRDGGAILYDGKDILDMGKDFRRLVGYMPQQQGFYEDFSARAFLVYMGGLKGISRKNAKKEADILLSKVNLTEHRKEPVGSFSGGMRQRVLLAQALLGDPRVLILDEPTTGLDPRERIRIRNFISDLAEERIILIATHVVSDVEFISKEILMLKDGKLLAKDNPVKLLETLEEKVVEVETDENGKNYLSQHYRISGLSHDNGQIVVRCVVPDRKELFQSGLKGRTVKPNLEDLYLYYFE